MRVSGWLVGLLGFGFLFIATGLCAFVAFSGTRGLVIDLGSRGAQVESPGDLFVALSNPDALIPTPMPQPTGEVVVTIPSITPDAPATSAPADATPGQTIPLATATGETPATDPGEQIVSPEPVEVASVDDFTWRDPRQVRILLMGIDQRTATGERGPFRSDTIIVVNVDPVRRTAGVISFPRDLWVSIPSFEPGRINTANYLGDLNAYPGGGGPRLLMETIALNFGIPIDYYVLINFDVFERVVDVLAPSGVEVCITETIRDDKYPDEAFGFLQVYFDPGCQRLNATRLLQFARTRATQGGDFDRARRQQQTLDALRAELLSLGGVTNFLVQIPTLYNELSANYRTNLGVEEIIRLGFLAGEIDRENISFAVVDNNYVTLGQSPTGDDVLIPIPGRINDLIQRVFYPQIQLAQADLLARSQAENATIRVFNGTDIGGLAGRTQEWLVGRGVRVSETGNASAHGSAPTIIRDYGNNRWTALYLADLLNLPPERIQPGTDGLAANGIVIVVGPDIQTILASQSP